MGRQQCDVDISVRGLPHRLAEGGLSFCRRSRLSVVAFRRTNAIAESVNSRVQKIEARACGYRNRERFRNAIYFHCGKLDLYPESFRPPATHTEN